MKSIIFIPLALMMCGTAWVRAIPQASRYDARVQQVVYNPLNVTVVNTRPGFMTTLVFDSDEAVISARPGFEGVGSHAGRQPGQSARWRSFRARPARTVTPRRW
jgi:type IV secretory pathway VirB9-like protein